MKNFRAKKSLGQNFLKSASALMTIVNAGEIDADDIILEVGPGKGALTEKLIFFAGKVIAIEKDHELFEFLKGKFKTAIDTGKLDLIHGDILDFDQNLLKFYDLPYKIIANIPYNITGAILKKFLSSNHQPERMVLLVQKEVAERIVARDGKESILSMSVKVYGKPKFIKKVPARYFSPAPKVDSAIISIENISKNSFTWTSDVQVNENRFFEIVKAGFAHKRKMLASNLEVGLPSGEWREKFKECGISEKTRAEDIELKDWICLLK